MKLRILKTTPEQLVCLFQGKTTSFAQYLPSDAEILDVKMDLFNKQVSMVVRSENFMDVAENIPVPEFNLFAVASESKVISKSVAALKEETAPEVKTIIPKPTQPPVSRYAAKMENEFSPEQRKLLSFSVRGDSVVVKPIQFLKAEWDDINDVVRGLGGRWVKGDIISYWEIPLG